MRSITYRIQQDVKYAVVHELFDKLDRVVASKLEVAILNTHDSRQIWLVCDALGEYINPIWFAKYKIDFT